MKIIVLHGDDALKSYERLQKFIDVGQNRSWEIIRIDSKYENIPEALAARGLFEKDKLVIVSDFGLLNKKAISWINQKKKSIGGTLIVYNSSPLSKTKLNSLKSIDKIESFDLPKLIWKFLDSFYPGNSLSSLKLLEELSKSNPVEFVFALLGRHIRDVYWAKIEPDTMPYPSWRVGKLKSQASKFSSSDEIRELINALADTDIESKTGSDSLKDLLDFIIITKLE